MRKRKIKARFFDAVSEMVDWNRMERLIDQHDTRSKPLDGIPAYPGIILFKMCLLGTWYGLSDTELEIGRARKAQPGKRPFPSPSRGFAA